MEGQLSSIWNCIFPSENIVIKYPNVAMPVETQPLQILWIYKMHAASGGMLFVSMQMRWAEGQQSDTHTTSHKGQSICVLQ